MSRLLIITSDLRPSGPARQLCELIRCLPADQVTLCVLGTESPWSKELCQAGVAVETLHWRTPLAIRPVKQLWELGNRLRPTLVHAWGADAAWPALLAAGGQLDRLYLSAALPPGRRPSPLQIQLLQRCGKVLALGQGEAVQCRRYGVAESRLSCLPAGLAVREPVTPVQWPALPETARVIVVNGPIAAHKGQLEAAWALDILAFLYPDLHLVLLGEGPGVGPVRSYVASTPHTRRVHFPGLVADVRPWLARAEIVWVPSRQEGGRMATVEALAAGKPVVAFGLPGLVELIDHGRTGLVVPPGDLTALARVTRSLLEDPAVAHRLGAAAREEAKRRFALDILVARYVQMVGLSPVHL